MNFIPISLMVSLSVVRFIQAMFISKDRLMKSGDKFAVPRTSDLMEELGQVEYIFSDKTGTLTKNLMEFRKCSVDGISYVEGLTEIRRQVMKRKGLELPPEPVPEPGSKVTSNVNFICKVLEKHLAGEEGEEKRKKLF